MRRAARNFATSSNRSLCAAKKNERRGANVSTASPAAIARAHVLDRVGEGERQLLHRRRSGLADVVARDRDRIPVRHLGRAEAEDLGDEAQRRRGRIDVRPAGDVFLEHVVLDRPADLIRADPALLGDHDVHREQRRRRGVDRHRRRHLVEREVARAGRACRPPCRSRRRRARPRRARAANRSRSPSASAGRRRPRARSVPRRAGGGSVRSSRRRSRSRRTAAWSRDVRGTSSAARRACRESVPARLTSRRSPRARRGGDTPAGGESPRERCGRRRLWPCAKASHRRQSIAAHGAEFTHRTGAPPPTKRRDAPRGVRPAYRRTSDQAASRPPPVAGTGVRARSRCRRGSRCRAACAGAVRWAARRGSRSCRRTPRPRLPWR